MSRAEFNGTPGQSSLKPTKTGLSRENWDEWDPYAYRGTVWLVNSVVGELITLMEEIPAKQTRTETYRSNGPVMLVYTAATRWHKIRNRNYHL